MSHHRCCCPGRELTWLDSGSTYNVVKIWPVGAEDFISKFRNSSAVHSQIHKPVVSLTAMAFHPCASVCALSRARAD